MIRNDYICKPNFSNIYQDHGNKYVQEYIDGITPHNVLKISDIGIRMEDYLDIIEINKDMTAIVLADGHGSERLFYGYFKGGYECAKLSVDYCIDKFKKLNRFTSQYIDKSFRDIVRFLFKNVQKECVKHLVNGSIRIKSDENLSFPCYKTGDNGFVSFIDGDYFDTIKNINRIKNWINILRKYYNENDILSILQNMVIGKILLTKKDKNGNNFTIPTYINYCKSRKVEIESGTTLTTSLIIKLPDGRYKILTGHVGDSSVILYRKKDKNKWLGILLTDDHSVSNIEEIKRGKKCGMMPSDKWFRSIVDDSKGLMPSRALGHPYLCKFGIIEDPYVSAEYLEKGDIVIFATDGLWDVEDDALLNISKIINMNHMNDANEIAKKLYEYYNNANNIRDNLSFIVMKME